MRNKMLKVLMVMVSLAPVSVYALGLGELNLHSYLSQPMAAEIELVGVQAGDAELLKARLASSEAYQKAGIERPFSLSALKFSVQERLGGQPFILVTTQNSVKEPFFYFLLELSSPDGNVLREYTVLLDPPPQQIAPGVAATQVEVPRVVRTTSDDDFKMPQRSSGVEGQYGPVEIGDTLWEIALKVRPDGVSINQAMIAIVRANPGAFVGGNVNQLLAGKVLTLPADEGYRELDVKAANAEFVRQNEAWKAYKEQALQIPPPLVIADSGDGQVVRETDDAGTVESGSASTAGRVRLLSENGSAGDEGQVGGSKSATGSTEQINEHIQLLEESLDVRERENQGLREQIGDLESQLGTLREMLEVAQSMPADNASQLPDGIEEPPVGRADTDELLDAVPLAGESEEADPQKDSQSATVSEAGGIAGGDESGQTSGEPVPVEATESAVIASNDRPRPKPTASGEGSGWLELVMDNLVYLAGLVLIAALVVVGIAVRGGKKTDARAQGELELDDEEATFERTPNDGAAEESSRESSSTESVDRSGESSAESFLDDFVAPTIGAADESGPEDVDPIAEADVFIAYGHHEQGEEIILDAIQYDDRLALKLKLLDIYFGQEKAEEYEQYAGEIRALLDGDDETWGKVVALGHALNPDSELFSGSTLNASDVGSLVAASSVEEGLDLSRELNEEETSLAETAVASLVLDDFAEGSGDESGEESSGSGGIELSTSIDLEPFAGDTSDVEPDDSEDNLEESAEETVSLDLSVSEGELADDDSGISPTSPDASDSSPPVSVDSEETDELADDDEATINFDSFDFDDEITDDSEDSVVERSQSGLVLDDDVMLEFETVDEIDVAADDSAAEAVEETSPDAVEDSGIEFELPDAESTISGSEDVPEAEALELDSVEAIQLDSESEGENLVARDAGPADGLDETVISFSLDLDGDSDIETVQSLDAVASQLDLLAAYVDMGDSDQASALNDQIQSHGDDVQKQQADELIKKLEN